MKIRFLVDRNVYAGDVVVQSFKAGEVAELSADSARHWLSRRIAEEVHGNAKVTHKPKPVNDPSTEAAAGESRDSGPAPQSAASEPAPVSGEKTPKKSVKSTPKAAAKSSS